ncbi:hypothetical protein SFRURICE_004373 [Spodoptera frugiperda]|nr:hypothetical protein SFRURICE_004373 [Spodoptera frugiperda]
MSPVQHWFSESETGEADDYKLHAWEVKVVYYYMRVSTKLVPRAFNEDGTIVTVRHCRAGVCVIFLNGCRQLGLVSSRLYYFIVLKGRYGSPDGNRPVSPMDTNTREVTMLFRAEMESAIRCTAASCPATVQSELCVYTRVCYVPILDRQANIVFCNPKGIGVSLAKNTILKACGPEITFSRARAVSFLSSRSRGRNRTHTNTVRLGRWLGNWLPHDG